MANNRPFIPPNGFVGFAQQTPAVQNLVRRRPARKKKRRTVKKKTATRRKKTATRKRGGRLVKGSAAAKRRMAQLRKMQSRNR